MRSEWRGAVRLRAATFLAGFIAGPSKYQTHVEAMANPFEFVQQVRAEAAKVIWPTRRETLITTGLVVMLVVFTSLFFLVVDEVLRTVVSLALGFGRGG
jgi:preprotein translocase subunit SecE